LVLNSQNKAEKFQLPGSIGNGWRIPALVSSTGNGLEAQGLGLDLDQKDLVLVLENL